MSRCPGRFVSLRKSGWKNSGYFLFFVSFVSSLNTFTEANLMG